MLKYSLIIPIFNGKSYLQECINSIICQGEYSLEVLLIDDGSTDGSAAICDDYASRYEFIRVFHQSNQGVSDSRNRGVELARGEYLFFIDGDDILPAGTLATIDKLVAEMDVDLVRWRFDSVSFDGQFNQIYQNAEEFISHCVGIWSPCLQLVKKSLFIDNRLTFDKNIILAEDGALFPRVYLFAKKMIAIDCQCYIYRDNESSTTKRKDYNEAYILRQLNSLILVFEITTKTMQSMSFPGAKFRLKEMLSRLIITFCMKCFSTPLGFSKVLKIHRIYSMCNCYPITANSSGTIKSKLMVQIFNRRLILILYYLSGFKKLYELHLKKKLTQ